MNSKHSNIIRKGLVAVTVSSAIVLGLGAVGASASNGASKSSDRSHEAHDEHEKDHDGIGHSDNEDHVGDGRGHDSHGNGHGYGHGDGCDDDGDENEAAPVSSVPVADQPADAPTDSPTDSPTESTAPVVGAVDVAVPGTDQSLPQQPETSVTVETTVPPVQPASLVEGVNVPTDAPADVVVTEPATAPEFESSVAAPAAGETAAQPTDDPDTQRAAGNLPMTGSSLIFIGLASLLAVGGFVVLVSRRRRDEVVA